MNLKVKQRMIGVIVFIAIIAIFLPILFHHFRSTHHTDMLTAIPNPPSQPTIEFELPGAKDQTEVVSQVLPKETPTQENIKNNDKKSVALNSKQISPAINSKISKKIAPNPSDLIETPTAWVIQIASFSDKNNAKLLVKTLQQEGLDAYLQENKELSGHPLTKVFVGPEIDLKRMEALKLKLAKKYKLMGVIKRYQI